MSKNKTNIRHYL